MNTVNTTSTKKQSGRRAGEQDTKNHILRVAQTLFSEQGLDATTMRQIADAAQVNPALIIHYFKSKQQLFIESVQPLLQAQQSSLVAEALQGSQDGIGQRLATLFAAMMSDEKRRKLMLSVMRTAVSNEHAAETLRTTVQRAVLAEIEKHIPGPDSRLKATLIGSQLIGMMMTRYIVKIEPLATEKPESIVKHLTPRLQTYFDEP